MRKCQNPDCDNNLPYDCRKEMRYCSVRCRVAMHRKARKKTNGIVVGKIVPMTQEERDQFTGGLRMKSNKQKTFEEWMDEDRFDGTRDAAVMRKRTISIPRYLFAKEVWAAAGGKFKSDEVSDEAN